MENILFLNKNSVL